MLKVPFSTKDPLKADGARRAGARGIERGGEKPVVGSGEASPPQAADGQITGVTRIDGPSSQVVDENARMERMAGRNGA